jgi:putative transposase
MDEQYLIATARYIELNPVKAGIVNKPAKYKWSRAQAHIQEEDDVLVKAGPLLKLIPNWHELLASELTEEEYEILRRHERSGRPLGSDNFLTKLEKITSRELTRQKPGPKKK